VGSSFAIWASASKRIRVSTSRRSVLLASSSSALAVLGQQQLEAGVGAVEAAGGVQARAEAEADRAGVDRARVDLGDVHQRPQARLPGRGELAEALADEAAVLAQQRDDVGDGGERHEVEVLVGHARVLAVGLQECLRELVRDGGGAEVRTWVLADPGVHDRGVRQIAVGAGAVVVGDDHVHPGRAGARDLLDRGDRAVDGDQQVGAALGQAVDGRGGEAVAVRAAAREVPVDVGADRAQRADEHGGGGHAVDVVVAVDGDPGVAPDVADDALGRLPETAERVQRVLVGGLQERARRLRLGHAAPHQHLGEHAGDAELRGQALGGRELVRLQGQACVLVGHA
jgi:hypothetical protein